MREITRGRWPCWFAGIALLLALPAVAQEPAPPAEPAPELASQEEREEAIPHIPQATILTRADEVTVNLRRLDELITDDRYIARQTAAADVDAEVIVDLQRLLDRADTAPVTSARLADLDFGWNRVRRTISTRAVDVEREWTDLRGELAQVVEARALWGATLDRALGTDYPPELIQRMDETIAALDSMTRLLETLNGSAAALAARISGQNEVTLAAIDRLEGITFRLARGLPSRGESRFYQLWPSAESPQILAELREAASYSWSTLDEFVSREIDSIYALLAVFISFLIMALWLLRRSRTWPADDDVLMTARSVVARPVAMATVFAVVLSRSILPEPVRSWQDALTLVVLLAVLRLGSRLLHPTLHRALYTIALIYVVNLPWQLLPADSVAGQWLLASGIIVALAGVAYVAAGFDSAREALGPSSWRLVHAGLYLSVAGLVLSLVVGAMGWIRLTRFLTAGFVLAVFAAIGFRVFYKTVVAVLPFLIRAPLAHVREGSRRAAPQLRDAAATLVGIFATYRYVLAVLDAFRLLTPLRRWVETAMAAQVEWGGLELSVGSTLAAIVILGLTPIAARVVRFVLREEVAPRLGFAPGVAYSITTLSGYVVWVLGITGAANAAGVSGTQMTVLFGAIGVGLGFGLQAIVNNFVSGLILMFERPLKVGDRIQTATHSGTVTDIGIRASNIRTFSGADVVVPNGDLITKEVINWTLSDDIRRIEVKLSTSYGTRPRQVLEILDGIAAGNERVLKDPAPAAVMHSFGESALNFELRAWVDAPDFVRVGSELHVLVEEALSDAGIDLVVPRREIVMRREEDDEPADVDRA